MEFLCCYSVQTCSRFSPQWGDAGRLSVSRSDSASFLPLVETNNKQPEEQSLSVFQWIFNFSSKKTQFFSVHVDFSSAAKTSDKHAETWPAAPERLPLMTLNTATQHPMKYSRKIQVPQSDTEVLSIKCTALHQQEWRSSHLGTTRLNFVSTNRNANEVSYHRPLNHRHHMTWRSDHMTGLNPVIR